MANSKQPDAEGTFSKLSRQQIDTLENQTVGEKTATANITDTALAIDIARSELRILESRNSFFGQELFSDFVWQALLFIFVSEHDGFKLACRDICRAFSIKPQLGQRYLGMLQKIELIEKSSEGLLTEQDSPTLTGSAKDKLVSILCRRPT